MVVLGHDDVVCFFLFVMIGMVLKMEMLLVGGSRRVVVRNDGVALDCKGAASRKSSGSVVVGNCDGGDSDNNVGDMTMLVR